MVATSALTGAPPDANVVTDLLMIVGETIVNSYLAHAIYNSAFRRTALPL
jgi:hypothetical protein